MPDGVNPAEIRRLLGLQPHPEGGHYREVFRDLPPTGARGACTAIYFLLEAGEVSAWHRVKDAVEIWCWHAGDPLALAVTATGQDSATVTLGPDLASGARPQAVVPAGHWQSARTLGRWTLVGCIVAPAFLFEQFELAPPGWPHTNS